VIFAGLLATIALTAVPYGAVQPWWLALFECVIFVIAIVSVIESLIGDAWSGRDVLLFTPLLLLTLFLVIQSLGVFPGSGPIGLRTTLSADPFATKLLAVELLALTVVALLLLRYTSSERRLRKLIYSVIAVGLLSAFYGTMRKGSGAFLPGLTVIDRSFGQFVNRNHFAFLMEMCLGLTLGLIIGERDSPRRRLVWVAVGVALWVALIYSNSRGGIFASLCQLLFLGVMVDPVRQLTTDWGPKSGWFQRLASGLVVRAALGIFLIVLFAAGVGWFGGEPVVLNFQQAATDFSQQEMQNNVNTSRKEIWRATWQMIKANPIAGVGFGGYRVAITRYHNASGAMTPQQAHNDYLELAAAGGVIAGALVIWFLVVVLKRARLSLKSPDAFYRAASLGALTGLFGVGVHSFVDFGLHITINALVFTVLLVIAVKGGLVAELLPRDGPTPGLAVADVDPI
jgi:O-antigen ligase